MRALTPLEARVLGVLVEKQATVPDTYPLSLNALVAGCNQKTARDPVIAATDAEVLTAVDGLKELSLVFEVSGSRVVRFEHNAPRVLGVPGAAVALLAVLMLRGPQTAAELRLNCERLHRFADISSVEAFLDELAAKDPPRVVRLPRAPGAREPRWAHRLCGDVALPAAAESLGGDAGGVSSGEVAALKAEQARLARELDALRATVQRIAGELGIDPDTTTS
ncbi:YceH family protein [Azohydromonas sp.]|uniref:YceH family protein n=1 Tax=Azohydromonas sp. TaxID=1872666 RepID=UPI002D1D8004|nr:YceH family protein [Azohydromonas sp.]HMM84163.1 YceH family protein [Azohydromonas sp.]